ncbi:alfa-amylase [Bifidobacterium hapali]|uniref:Alfa-amylase n=1 Tax=Bifidobacterium hapali TaxID=1630172 RepID=A0A261G182_9BIFI|nr:AraC family transcriptional regulator [Bifidobacterium hapali]OZG65177.1 alfa-amylase [Bifidobacterium hapali]
MGTLTYHPNVSIAIDGWTIEIMRIVYGPILTPIPFHAHGRGCYELHYNESGHGTVFIDNEQYDIAAGSFYITGPGVRHAQLSDSTDPIYEYCLNLALREPPSTSQRDDYLPRALSSMSRFIGDDRESLAQLFARLFDEYRQRRAGYRPYARALLEEILIASLRNNTRLPRPQQPYDAEDSANKAVPDTDTQRSMFIDQYFLRDYATQSLSGLADELSLSQRQTQRLLYRYYGKSFSQKTLESRMSVAQLMLTKTEESIANVARYAGYVSTAHFGAAFRAYCGMSASEYRIAHRVK